MREYGRYKRRNIMISEIVGFKIKDERSKDAIN